MVFFFIAGAAGGLVKSVLLHGNAIILPEKFKTQDNCEMIALGTTGDLIVGGVCGYLSEDPNFMMFLNQQFGPAFAGTPSLAMAILAGFAAPVILEMVINRWKQFRAPPECHTTRKGAMSLVFV